MRCSAAAAAAELEQQRSRERKMMTERGRMKKRPVMPIYKEKTDKAGAKTEEAEIMGIQLVRTPRFSGWLLKIRIY